MERQLRKNMNDTAKYFIVSAYRVGVSTLLIDRFLRESDWDCTMYAVHDTLWENDIQPTDFNCSSDSLTWRRYLTNILETSGVSTYEQYEEVALQEAKDYYNINNMTFIEYWYDFKQFTRELKFPLDPAWIMRALLYFGYTFTRLSMKLRKENIPVTPTDLYNIYNVHAGRHDLSIEELRLIPKFQPSLAVKHFWRSSHQIGKDIDTIIQWTEIFTGTITPVETMNQTIRSLAI